MDFATCLPVSGIGNNAIPIENYQYDSYNIGQVRFLEESTTVMNDMNNELPTVTDLVSRVSLDGSSRYHPPKSSPNSRQNMFRTIRPNMLRLTDKQQDNNLPQREKRRFGSYFVNSWSRRRIDHHKRSVGSNPYGRAGNLGCGPCRRRHSKVYLLKQTILIFKIVYLRSRVASLPILSRSKDCDCMYKITRPKISRPVTTATNSYRLRHRT